MAEVSGSSDQRFEAMRGFGWQSRLTCRCRSVGGRDAGRMKLVEFFRTQVAEVVGADFHIGLVPSDLMPLPRSVNDRVASDQHQT